MLIKEKASITDADNFSRSKHMATVFYENQGRELWTAQRPKNSFNKLSGQMDQSKNNPSGHKPSISHSVISTIHYHSGSVFRSWRTTCPEYFSAFSAPSTPDWTNQLINSLIYMDVVEQE